MWNKFTAGESVGRMCNGCYLGAPKIRHVTKSTNNFSLTLIFDFQVNFTNSFSWTKQDGPLFHSVFRHDNILLLYRFEIKNKSM